MLNLLIARHGNTFDKGDEILRVGKRTDLPLSNSGQEQARNLGKFLKQHFTEIHQVYVSNLIRTQQTAQLALETMTGSKHSSVFEINSLLDEIDYGPDEGQPENKVIERIGLKALEQWEANATVPQDWLVKPCEIIQGWKDLSQDILQQYQQHLSQAISETKNILLVTSNGIARFAPYITGDFESFSKQYAIKMKTGAISCFQYCDQKSQWRVKFWNQRDSKGI